MHRWFAVFVMSLASVCTASAMEYGFKTGLVNSSFDYFSWDIHQTKLLPYFPEKLTSLSMGIFAEHDVLEWASIHTELLYLQKGGTETQPHSSGWNEHEYLFRREVRVECLRAGFSVRPGMDISSLRVFSIIGVYADLKLAASGVYPGDFFQNAYTGLSVGAGVEFRKLKRHPSIEIIHEKEHEGSFPENRGTYRFRQVHARLLFGF